MNDSRKKRQPLTRTLFTEFQTSVAELTTRKPVMKGTIAKRLTLDSNYITGDATCDAVVPFSIEGIKTAVLIQCYRSLKIAITVDGVTLPYTLCHGLFQFYGELERVDILAAENQTERFTYVRS